MKMLVQVEKYFQEYWLQQQHDQWSDDYKICVDRMKRLFREYEVKEIYVFGEIGDSLTVIEMSSEYMDHFFKRVNSIVMDFTGGEIAAGIQVEQSADKILLISQNF